MKGFKIGDKVKFYFNSYSFYSNSTLTGTITHIPSDVGDWFYLDDETGRRHAVNPCSVSVETAIKLDKE